MDINISGATDDLKKKLTLAENLEMDELAARLVAAGFACTGCGECCKDSSGDNSVIVFPDEISNIMQMFMLEWHEICNPTQPLFKDRCGKFHAFEWRLKRGSSGDCTFLEDNMCRIYPKRPWICRTYPFYLVFDASSDRPSLMISECQGVGGTLPDKAAMELSRQLKQRLIEEIWEEIKVLENLEGCDDLEYVNDISMSIPSGSMLLVHDSYGSRRFKIP